MRVMLARVRDGDKTPGLVHVKHSQERLAVFDNVWSLGRIKERA
jgi:hypothetical protein